MNKKTGMRLISLELLNLHGYLTKKINFRDNINILVGINGSGKTSILNLINWLVSPSLEDLSVNYFDKVILQVLFNDCRYNLIATQEDRNLVYEVESLDEKREFYPLEIKLKNRPIHISSTKQKLSAKQEIGNLMPTKEEQDTYDFIFNVLSKPIVIGLDRNLYKEEGNVRSYIDNPSRSRRNIDTRTPIDYVHRLASLEYREFKSIANKLDDELRGELMISSFEDPLTNKIFKESVKIDVEEVEELEEKVNIYFQTDNEDYNILLDNKLIVKFRKKINYYFKTLKQQLLEYDDNKDDLTHMIALITNIHKFKKIRRLVDIFNEIEQKKNQAKKRIQKYLNTVNYFFNDSGKEIYFDDVSSRLLFRITNNKSNAKKIDKHSIDSLSSGEKQILILFTFINFSHDQGKIFIIDEPELSLHPKWQESFLDKIIEILPDETQLVFASHSPLIVSNHEEYVEVVMPE